MIEADCAIDLPAEQNNAVIERLSKNDGLRNP